MITITKPFRRSMDSILGLVNEVVLMVTGLFTIQRDLLWKQTKYNEMQVKSFLSFNNSITIFQVSCFRFQIKGDIKATVAPNPI
jgi:hypothetical protein